MHTPSSDALMMFKFISETTNLTTVPSEEVTTAPKSRPIGLSAPGRLFCSDESVMLTVDMRTVSSKCSTSSPLFMLKLWNLASFGLVASPTKPSA